MQMIAGLLPILPSGAFTIPVKVSDNESCPAAFRNGSRHMLGLENSSTTRNVIGSEVETTAGWHETKSGRKPELATLVFGERNQSQAMRATSRPPLHLYPAPYTRSETVGQQLHQRIQIARSFDKAFMRRKCRVFMLDR